MTAKIVGSDRAMRTPRSGRDDVEIVFGRLLSELTVELVERCPGHMGTSTFHLVARWRDKIVFDLLLGDDGFDDGEMSWHRFLPGVTRQKRKRQS